LLYIIPKKQNLQLERAKDHPLSREANTTGVTYIYVFY